MVKYELFTKDLIVRPARVFRDIARHPDAYFKGALVLLVVNALLSAIITTIPLPVLTGSQKDAAPSGLQTFLLAPLFVLIQTAFVLLGSKIFKGRATFKKVFYALTHISLLTVVLFIPGLLIIFFVPILYLVFGILSILWVILLMIIAIKEINEFSVWRAIGAFVVPLLILIGILVVIVLLVVILAGFLV